MPPVTVPQALELALQHHQAGRLAEADALYRQILAVQPNHPDALHLLGLVACQAGHSDAAVGWIRQAIALKPNYPEAYNNLGAALRDKGQLDEAIASCRQAIALRPNYPEAFSNLGNALRDQGLLDEASSAYRQAIAFDPNLAGAHFNLGNVLRDKGQLDEAIASYRQAIALRPDYPEAYCNLGNALRDQQQLDEAIAAYQRAIALGPNLPEARSNLVLILHYHPGYDGKTIGEEQRRWNRQHAEPLRPFIQPHRNHPAPERRLRIGYVSADFRGHVVGRYLLPLFEHHDRTEFELCCYSGVWRPDEVTARFQSLAGQWRSTLGLGDPQLAELIREDGVDVLVDLSLHSAGNRLPVFARQPAPVQVSYAGYPGSTGLEAIGYRMSDRWLESELGDGRSECGVRSAECGNSTQKCTAGSASQIGDSGPDIPHSAFQIPHSERVYLLDSFWCFEPCGAEVPVGALPAMENKGFTFGCLNNFCKVNERVLALWARILGKVEGSRLLLLSPAGSHRERTLTVLRQLGVEGSRVEFVVQRPRREYLEWYHRIDVGLETFPYNGHTTSLDAFWMGVPVPGMVGELPVARAGLSHLMNLGLPELVARSEEEYVNLVVALAGDLPRMAELRATLRERMKASVLMDAPRYARNIEAAYRAMWRRWCAGTGMTNDE